MIKTKLLMNKSAIIKILGYVLIKLKHSLNLNTFL